MSLAFAAAAAQAVALSGNARCSRSRHWCNARNATRCQAGRGPKGGGRGSSGGGGRGGGGIRTRQQEERRGGDDVEIFSIDSGWNVDALGDVADLLGTGSEGWSVSAAADGDVDAAVDGSSKAGGWSVSAIGDDDTEEGYLSDFSDDEDEDASDDVDAANWQAAPNTRPGSAAAVAAAAALPVFNGRVLRKAEQQLLSSLPVHMISRLEAEQQEADEERDKLKPAAMKKAAARLRTHQQLRIISGSAAGKRLRSPQGDQTRPMMEMVRNAVFNMVMSLYGCSSGLPEDTRWLDLYAGTGAVGLEALSRGVAECHFVEMSPWVVRNCLMPNLETCELESAAVVHTGKAEDFLRRAQQLSRFAGGPFDFMSVCPPYELVDYDEIYDLLEKSPLLHEESIVIVEYPKKLASLVRQNLGPLEKLRDRRYGRTYLAIYGPPEA